MKTIHWVSMKTGRTGHGDPSPDSVAESEVARLNEQYRYITHWAEKSEGDES